MSDSKNRVKYEQIVQDLRSDFENIKKLYSVLLSKAGDKIPDEEIQHWIMDVFMDKLYELDLKIIRIVKEITGERNTISSATINTVVNDAHLFAFTSKPDLSAYYRESIGTSINSMVAQIEGELSNVKRRLMGTEWVELDKIKPIEYVSLERKKYVTAREELNKAKEKINEHPEDVMGYLRTSIDLSIKERFDFKKIHKMINFLEDAQRLNFPLPSYSIIYTYFNEGSKRLHEGKINTSFETREAIRTVSNFIDELELIQISSEQIENFKKECLYIE